MKSSVLLPKLYLKRENSNPKLFLSEIAFGQLNGRLRATKPKPSGIEPEGIVNKDLGYVSQIFLPKTMGNDTVPYGFVYVIVPQISMYIYSYPESDFAFSKVFLGVHNIWRSSEVG